ncbi:MAG: alpha/beta hydrolase [Candidatus Heimdallarchaeota archaeon]|nr:alpha/beta hydrolase [Candidatus Heimdallarchaeota archaeon]
MSDGINVAIYKLIPKIAKQTSLKEPILFIPGFNSYFRQWSTIINYLVQKNHTVYVFESREKNSSTSKVTDERFNTDGLVSDLKEVVQLLKLSQPFFMIGNSLGTTIILAHIINNREERNMLPEKAALIQAVYTSEPLRKYINLAKRKFLFKFVMKSMRLFAPIIFWRKRKKEPKAYENSLRNLKHTDIEKMRIGLICSVELQILNDLPKVNRPILAIGITNDDIHPIAQAKLIAEKIVKGSYIEIPDKEKVDSEDTARIISKYLEE